MLFKAEKAKIHTRELHNQKIESFTLVREDEIRILLNTSWQGNPDVELQAREAWRKIDSEQSCALLAEALMDTHIHPDSGLERDSIMFWEAQYL